MSDFNRIILSGHLGGDPEIRFAPSGTQVATFSIASGREWEDKNGDSHGRVEWTNIVVFGRLADACEKYLHKGSAVLIDGRKQTREYEDKYKNKKQTVEVIVEKIKFLDPRGAKDASQKEPAPGDSNYVDDDDLPF